MAGAKERNEEGDHRRVSKSILVYIRHSGLVESCSILSYRNQPLPVQQIWATMSSPMYFEDNANLRLGATTT